MLSVLYSAIFFILIIFLIWFFTKYRREHKIRKEERIRIDERNKQLRKEERIRIDERNKQDLESKENKDLDKIL